jgi:hypothetical protein
MHAMNPYEGRECIKPLIVNLYFTFQLLYPRYLLNRRLCGPQIWSGSVWRREIVLLLPGIENDPSVLDFKLSPCSEYSTNMFSFR